MKRFIKSWMVGVALALAVFTSRADIVPFQDYTNSIGDWKYATLEPGRTYVVQVRVGARAWFQVDWIFDLTNETQPGYFTLPADYPYDVFVQDVAPGARTEPQFFDGILNF